MFVEENTRQPKRLSTSLQRRSTPSMQSYFSQYSGETMMTITILAVYLYYSHDQLSIVEYQFHDIYYVQPPGNPAPQKLHDKDSGSRLVLRIPMRVMIF